MAGAALCAHGRTFAWQAWHFDSLGIAGARLGAGGARLQLRGRRNTFCIWSNFCVAGAALGAHGPTFAQGQHLVPVLKAISIGWKMFGAL